MHTTMPSLMSATAAGPRSLHVAVVDDEAPYPLTTGKRIRSANLLMHLARRHRITYLCNRNRDPQEARQATQFLGDHGIRLVFTDQCTPARSVEYSRPRLYARAALNLLSPWPYVVTANCGRALHQAVRDHAARHQVDLWHCEWTPCAHVLRERTDAPQVVVAHNIESQVWQRYHEMETSPLKRWFVQRQWRKFARFERQVFARSAHTVTVSAPDAEQAAQLDAARIAVVDNGVDPAYFQATRRDARANEILFLGSMDYRPNLDAIQLLLDKVFPAVRGMLPEARLCIVGRNPPDWVQAAQQRFDGVEVLANVPDVRPYLARAAVMAVPLRIGGGSRLKILEALAAGTPVVSTRVGAEGLDVAPGRHLLVVEQVEDMARPLVEIMREPALAQELAGNGRRLVEERYDWKMLAQRLEEVWLRCVHEWPEGRS